MKNNKVLLINPRSVSYNPPSAIECLDRSVLRDYSESINKAIQNKLGILINEYNAFTNRYCINQGLLKIGTAISKYVQVEYVIGDFFEQYEDFINEIEKQAKDSSLVCLTATTPQIKEIQQIATLCKTFNPQIKTILGGPHSLHFIHYPIPDCFDSVQIGSGCKQTIQLILNYLQNGIDINKRNISFDYVEYDIDYSLLPIEKIRHAMLYTFTSFGCPRQCAYCVEHKLGRNVVYCSIQKKLEEIKYIASVADKKFIHLADSDFFLNTKHAKEVVRELASARLEVCYSVNISPQTMIRGEYREILKEFVEIGLVEILIGVEHCSMEVLEKVGKPYNQGKFEEELFYIKHVLNVPIVSLYTLVGLPFEHEKQIVDNVKVLTEWKDKHLFDYTFPKFFVPYPSTEIYLNPEKYNIRILTDDFSQYNRWCMPRPIEIVGMSDDKYIAEIESIYKLML